MIFNISKVRNYLKCFDFKTLFIEELGWDHYNKHLEIRIDSHTFTLSAIAEKRGMAAFLCPCLRNGRIPDYVARRKIEKQTAISVHEHIIIYTDNEETMQIWQWVKREPGKPAACREHTYHKNQTGDSLLQKLQNIAFSLEEEEALTLPHVTGRMRKAFNVERVTKRFYDRFKKEHDSFFSFIMGIPDDDLHRWYASVMLNRLMFIYFVQKKGFLDSDTDYLRNKLMLSKQQGKDLFYKDVLCPLFFEGFAKKAKDRSEKMNKLLGEAPYLNGGLFLKHQIEELHGKDIQIADNAFEKLFEFFDQYQWHLDERPLRKDNEINFKSIIVKNLYGVDIMEEAIEICKLRLFLKLVAQIESIEHIEPLPDIDFNIRAGNTLVGFATYEEVKKAVTGRDQMAMQFDDTMQRIEEQAEDVDRLFQLFHKQQTELGGEVAPEDKQALKDKLKVLEDELNQYLAGEYGISFSPLERGAGVCNKDESTPTLAKGGRGDFQKWLKSHHPFHWFIEFYGILKNGGFDVIIGNPPYVEYSKVKKEYTIKGYKTESCGNLYAYIVER